MEKIKKKRRSSHSRLFHYAERYDDKGVHLKGLFILYFVLFFVPLSASVLEKVSLFWIFGDFVLLILLSYLLISVHIVAQNYKKHTDDYLLRKSRILLRIAIFLYLSALLGFLIFITNSAP